MKTRFCLIAALTLLVFWAGDSPAATVTSKTPLVLAEGNQAACVIIYSREEKLDARTAAKLAAFLKEQVGSEPVVMSDNRLAEAGATNTLVVIDGTKDHRLIARYGGKVEFKSDRAEAYQLVVRKQAGRGLVLAAGQSPVGAKQAIYRLMKEMQIENSRATIEPLEVQAEPFIKNRSVGLFNIWGMPLAITREHNIETWPVAKIRAYVDMFDAFGFNAIETHDRFNDGYTKPTYGVSRQEWRNKVWAICDQAHANGQKVFLRAWGNTVMRTPEDYKPSKPGAGVPKKPRNLCVNLPEERRIWEEEIRDYYVTNYAGKIDHFIGHWCDNGGCRRNGCTLETAMKLQMELHNGFKKADPNFTSSFNLWMLSRFGGWAGYEDERSVCDAGILSKDVCIAMNTRLPHEYSESMARNILASGHRPAVWTWYRADYEIKPSVHIHLHERVGEYFRELPASASELEWHNVECNVHGAANVANYYVAAQMMWDQRGDTDQLLREFLRLTFGADNADKIAPAYLAIEAIRCPTCHNKSKDCFPGCGTANPRRDEETAAKALAQIKKVKVSPTHKSRLPLIISREKILGDLRDSLEVIKEYAHCRTEELPKLDAAIKDGQVKEASEMLKTLKAKCTTWSGSLTRVQESRRLNAELASRQQTLKGLK
jgi:hypothetical protein